MQCPDGPGGSVLPSIQGSTRKEVGWGPPSWAAAVLHRTRFPICLSSVSSHSRPWPPPARLGGQGALCCGPLSASQETVQDGPRLCACHTGLPCSRSWSSRLLRRWWWSCSRCTSSRRPWCTAHASWQATSSSIAGGSPCSRSRMPIHTARMAACRTNPPVHSSAAAFQAADRRWRRPPWPLAASYSPSAHPTSSLLHQ